MRSPLARGQAVRHDGGSVVILGDVPRGCVVDAAGDVVVMGRLEGEARAGAAAAMVAALAFGPEAAVWVGGAKAGKVRRAGESREEVMPAALADGQV
jgi:septum formation inhibitor MinC